MKIIKDSSQAGMTLIEVIVVLIIVGVLAVGLSTGLVKAVENYVLASEAAQLSQQAQLSLARIKKELTDITAIYNDVSADQIQYTRPYSSPSCQQQAGCRYRIQKSGSQILLTGISPQFDAQVLVDNVADDYSGNAFMTYTNFNNGIWTYETDDKINNLARITVVLILTYGSNNSRTLQFDTIINPRQSSLLNAPKLN